MFFAKFCCKSLAFLKLFGTKNAENDYFNQRLEWQHPNADQNIQQRCIEQAPSPRYEIVTSPIKDKTSQVQLINEKLKRTTNRQKFEKELDGRALET